MGKDCPRTFPLRGLLTHSPSSVPSGFSTEALVDCCLLASACAAGPGAKAPVSSEARGWIRVLSFPGILEHHPSQPKQAQAKEKSRDLHAGLLHGGAASAWLLGLQVGEGGGAALAAARGVAQHG